MTEAYLNYLRYELNRSELTVRNYEHSLKNFEAYFKHRDSQLSWESVDSDIIRDWMESLMDKNAAASTVNNCLSAVRSFYRFALARGLVTTDPAHTVSGPKKPKQLPHFVREQEMDWLLDSGQVWGDGYKDVRARTIIILLYETGIRLAELVGLDCVDVDMAQRLLKVTGKRNKQRIVPFGAELHQMLATYVQQRNGQPGSEQAALFVSPRGKRITRIEVQRIVRRYLSLATTQQRKTPHVLRHTFATAMLNNGATLESIRKLLGHTSVQTTEIYTHTTFEQLKQVYEHAHPRAEAITNTPEEGQY